MRYSAPEVVRTWSFATCKLPVSLGLRSETIFILPRIYIFHIASDLPDCWDEVLKVLQDKEEQRRHNLALINEQLHVLRSKSAAWCEPEQLWGTTWSNSTDIRTHPRKGCIIVERYKNSAEVGGDAFGGKIEPRHCMHSLQNPEIWRTLIKWTINPLPKGIQNKIKYTKSDEHAQEYYFPVRATRELGGSCSLVVEERPPNTCHDCR